MYSDQTLTCVDCSTTFTFSASEQEFFNSKGFTSKPTRCADCRAARKAQRGGSAGGGRGSFSGARQQREMFSTTCSGCGKTAEVPFEPRGNKPVYCRECFSARSSTYR